MTVDYDRRQGIGGSDVPIILGMSPYRSALDLWNEKRGDTIPREPSLAMDIGTMLEDGIARLYAKYEDVRLTKPTRPFGLLPDLTVDPRMAERFGYPTWTQIDRWRIGRPRRGVEVKHTSLFDRFDDGFTPDDVQVQVQHAMMLTGAKSWDVVALAAGRRYIVNTIDADPDVHEAMREACASFWRQVTTGEEPEPDGSDAAGAYLRSKYPQEEPDEAIEASGDQLPLLAELLRATAVKDEADKQYELARQRVMQIMGTAAVLLAPGDLKVTWKTQPGQKAWKDIAGDLERLIEANAERIELPEGDGTVRDWLDFIQSMHTGAPKRVFRVSGKVVSL